jgi:hypothetical protein
MSFFGATYFTAGPEITQDPGTPGAVTGLITLPLIIGDDYLEVNGRSLHWYVYTPLGTTVGASSTTLRFVQASGACYPFEIEISGTITQSIDGISALSFDLTDIQTATIPPGEYFWFVEWLGDAGEVITKVYNRQLVIWKSKEAT